MNIGQKVYVAEVGHGARPSHVKAVESDREGVKVLVQIDGQTCYRTCFARSVFDTAEAAEASLNLMETR